MNISVIIPVYNTGEQIKTTIQSIYNSGLQAYEILLIDDGSNERTARICDVLQSENSNIRCVHQQNTGVSIARNRGIQESTGNYLLFIDADDTLEKDSLGDFASVLTKEKPDMLIFGMTFDYYFRRKCYRRESLNWPKDRLMTKEEIPDQLNELFDCNALSPVWNKIIRRDMIIRNKIAFRPEIHEMEDFLFSIDCLRCCNSIYVSPKCLYHYRQTEDERGTYNRLKKVQSLNEYMRPFEDTLMSAYPEQGEALLSKVYCNMFLEQIRFGNRPYIVRSAFDMLSGPYAAVLETQDPQLYEKLKNGRFNSVWFDLSKSRLRHALAVRIKYLRSLL